MITTRTFRISTLARFGWRNAILTAVWATVVWWMYARQGWHLIAIPFLPVATIGTAVAFYVGFKNNSSYERLWEARKIWGEVVNVSRSLTIDARSILGSGAQAADSSPLRGAVRELAYRQIAWVNALRLQLRRPSPLNTSRADQPQARVATRAVDDTEEFERDVRRHLEAVLPDAVCDYAMAQQNISLHLLAMQARQLADLKSVSRIDGFEHALLLRHVTTMTESQGKCERIKTFPFPRQYANFSLIFVVLFNFLLPLGLVREMDEAVPGGAWLAIPFTLLIGWVFYSMEQVGDASENPFENAVNDVPMSAICRNIEIDLKELLGEPELPEKLQPTDGILL